MARHGDVLSERPGQGHGVLTSLVLLGQSVAGAVSCLAVLHAASFATEVGLGGFAGLARALAGGVLLVALGVAWGVGKAGWRASTKVLSCAVAALINVGVAVGVQGWIVSRLPGVESSPRRVLVFVAPRSPGIPGLGCERRDPKELSPCTPPSVDTMKRLEECRVVGVGPLPPSDGR